MNRKNISNGHPGEKPNIVGVDFSGSKNSNTTAVTTAVFRNNLLEITDCYPLGSKLESAHGKLRNLLEDLPNDAVVAMDFPFSIPRVPPCVSLNSSSPVQPLCLICGKRQPE